MKKLIYLKYLKVRSVILANQPGFIKEYLLKKWYKKKTGKSLNLKAPRTFNEKIQWLKLYDTTDLKTELSDKWLVREYVSRKIGEQYLIPAIGCWEHFDDVDFSSFPDRFVIKANHGSGWNIIVEDKDKFDIAEARKMFEIWLNSNFAFSYGYEYQYMNIAPRIIAECCLAELQGNDLLDYRFFCFDGIPKSVWVDSGSGTENHKRNIYDMNWVLQDYNVNYPNIEFEIEKPDNYDEMVLIATKLSNGFSFVRVDLYSVNNQVYFGELTFTPQSGTGRWDHEEKNLLYGEMITLPFKKKLPRLRR